MTNNNSLLFSRMTAALVATFSIVTLTVPATHSAEPVVQTKELKLVQMIHHDDLDGNCDVEVSRDGKHLYGPSFRAGTITHFAIDPKTGTLQYVESIKDQSQRGTTDFRLFPNGNTAVSCACSAKTVVLYKRETDSGRLRIARIFTRGDDETSGLDWPVDLAVSPDGNFVYVADSKYLGKAKNRDAARGAVTIFQVNEGLDLNWVDSNYGENGCFGGARGVLCHPNGRQVFATCHRANTLVVCQRDPDVGLIQVTKVFRQGVDGVECLQGAMIVSLSPDGRYLYSAAGLFSETGGVGVFHIAVDGSVTLLQQFVNGRDGFENFRGGNKVIVSPDGRRVYAAATVSGSLTVFERDLETGRLKLIETLVSGKNGVQLLGANGMTFDASARHLYLACEDDKGIAVFEILREPDAAK